MAVEKNDALGSYTPVCDDCGIRLCWDVGPLEYAEEADFWDVWKCRDCNPDYAGALEKFKKERKINS